MTSPNAHEKCFVDNIDITKRKKIRKNNNNNNNNTGCETKQFA